MPVFDPKKLLKEIAPASKIKKLINNKLSLNRAMLSMFSDIKFIKKKDITSTVLTAVKQYKAKYRGLIKEGESKTKALAETLNEKKMLINNVQNTVVYNISTQIKDKYEGEFYRWLPSDAMEPRPEHALNYGKVFKVGEGEQPGEAFGCRCGMEILTPEKDLVL